MLAGGAGGYWLHTPPPAPKVEVHEVEKSKIEYRDREVEKVTEGPVRVVERWRTTAAAAPPPPGCPACPGCEEHTRIEERGPVVAERREVASVAAKVERVAEVVVTPPPPVARPSWAVSGGLQLIPDQRLELGLDRRLFGPFWVRAWVLQPAALSLPAVGVGLRAEF